MKLAEVAPPEIVTVAGGLAAMSLLESETAVPVEGAGALNVTVPVAEVPPTTELGFKATDIRFAGLTVRSAVVPTPDACAETTAMAWTLTGIVLTVNVAEV